MNKTSALLAAIFMTLAPSAFAADHTDYDWIVRFRAIDVHPDQDGYVAGTPHHVRADNAIVPELDFTYFFTKNVAAELILATSNHDMSTNTGLDVGDVWVLPPQVTMQYHFNPEGKFRPYAGAGLGYIMYYNPDSGSTFNKVKYKDGISYTLQAGIDIGIDERWAVNFDVKKIFHETTATIDGALKADVDLDPWVFGVGVAYRF